MKTQYWLAEIDQHGNPRLVDGPHSEVKGVEKVLYLNNALGLSRGAKYAGVKVEIFDVTPDGSEVNHDAIAVLHRETVG